MINILLILGFLSLFGIFFMIIRKVPILMKLPRQPEVVLHPQPLMRKIIHLKFSSYFNFIIIINWIERNLRKIRIYFLKLDQWLMELIKKVRERSQILTIRYYAWLDQRKIKRIKVRVKTDSGREIIKETVSITDGLGIAIPAKAVAPVRDFKTEEDALIKLLTQNPKDVAVYKKLGYFYLEQKNYHDAREAFNQVLKLKPRDKEAKEQISKLPPVE